MKAHPSEEIPDLATYFRERAAVKPFRPLSHIEIKVVDLLARGWSYKRIAFGLRMSPRTVQGHVHMIAMLLPSDDDLPAKEKVQIWAGCVAWDRAKRESEAVRLAARGAIPERSDSP